MLIPFGVFSAAGAGAGSAGSYDLISTTVLGSNTASVTFDVTGLGSTYKHLQIRMVAQSTSTDNSGWRWVRLQGTFNSDTTNSNYAIHQLYANAGSAFSYAETSSRKGYGIAARNSEAGFSASIIDILDAFSSSKNKTSKTIYGMTGSNSSNDSTSGMLSHLWMNTSAITSINITTEDGSNFKTGSRFSIYGSKGV